MAWFINYYRCPRCGQKWCDEWSARRDDDCPACGMGHLSPYKSDDERPEPVDVLRELARIYRRLNGTAEDFTTEDKLALLLDLEDGVFAALGRAEDEGGR